MTLCSEADHLLQILQICLLEKTEVQAQPKELASPHELSWRIGLQSSRGTHPIHPNSASLSITLGLVDETYSERSNKSSEAN